MSRPDARIVVCAVCVLGIVALGFGGQSVHAAPWIGSCAPMSSAAQMRAPAPVLVAPATAAADAETASSDGRERLVATFSIVAADTAAGIWGVAVASKFFAVGAVVPWVRAGAGAVATQASANTTYGPRGLEWMEAGLSAEALVDSLLRGDEGGARRQVGLVDAQGRSASYTGPECMEWAGGRSGPGYAAQGNILTGPEVVDAMAKAFEATSGFLGDRLLAALRAGEAAGGDRRGRQSAALYMAAEGRGYSGLNDRYCDLRVDDHEDPFGELDRLYAIWRPNQLVLEGYQLVEQERYAEAIALGEEAARMRPEDGAPLYHLACYHSRAGDHDRAVAALARAFELQGDLREAAASDPDLVPLHGRKDYQELMSAPATGTIKTEDSR